MVRLYPDIIVATAINNQRKLYIELEGKLPDEINLNIGNLLDLQDLFLHFDFMETPVVGYEGKQWGIDDYERYFAEYPKYFICSSWGVWIAKESIVKDFNYNKILSNIYSMDVLKKLGLFKG